MNVTPLASMPMPSRSADAIAGVGAGFGDLLSAFGTMPMGEGEGMAPSALAEALLKPADPPADEAAALPESEALPTAPLPESEAAEPAGDAVPDQQPVIDAAPETAADAPAVSRLPIAADPSPKPAPAKDGAELVPTGPQTASTPEPAPAAGPVVAKAPLDKAPQRSKPDEAAALETSTTGAAALPAPVAAGDPAATGRKDSASLDRLPRREGKEKIATDDRASSRPETHSAASSDPQPSPILAATPAPAQDQPAPGVTGDPAGSTKTDPQSAAAPSLPVGTADARHADAATPEPQPGQDNLPSLLASQTPSASIARFAPAAQPYAAPAQVPAQPVIPAQTGRIGRDMGVEIARQVSAGRQEMLVRLDPAEMGRIDVRLSFDDKGHLHATLSADSPAALDMLRRDAGDLGRALADAGIRADTSSFRFDSRGGDAGQFTQHQQQGGQHGDARDHHGGTRRGRGGNDLAAIPASYRQLRTSGRVDLTA